MRGLDVVMEEGSEPDRATERPAPAPMALLAASATVAFAVLAAGPGGPGIDTTTERVAAGVAFLVAAGVVVARAVREPVDRRPWACLAVASSCYAGAYVGWAAGAPEVVVDTLWVAFFPATYAAGVLVMRRWARDTPSQAWLDGVIAGCGAAAVAIVLFLPAFPRDDGGRDMLLAYFYPLGDLALLLSVTVAASAAGWHPGRAYVFGGLAYLLILAGDVVYLDDLADGARDAPDGTVSNLLWIAAMTLIAVAVWQPVRLPSARATHAPGWSSVVVPLVFIALSVGVLLGHDLDERPTAVVLAAVCVLASATRMLMTFRELQTLAETNRIALTDDLTGLQTRRAITLAIDGRIAAHPRDDAPPLAVILLDLEGFGAVTGALGTPAGDEVLRRVAERLRALAGGPRGIVVARLGADEFALAIPGMDSSAALAVARVVLARVAEPMTVADVALELDAHVGIAAWPEHEGDVHALLRHASAALEHARRRRRPVVVYEPAFDLTARARLTMLGELRQALADGQIVAHFQPQVDPATGTVHGVEALVRWEHPERGLIPPGAFLDVAAASGLMRVLTERVLALALERVAAWHAAGIECGVSVNVAAPNLLDRDFPAHVADALRAAGVPPSALTLEITEDVLMTETDQAIEDLERLRALGVRLSLDDFGTGHSSLAKLKRLPIQELKIDRSFVCRLTEDADDLAIVETTVRLARSFQLAVVAEGVEDDAAWALLAELGCDTIQGYRLARPLPPDAIDAWLAAAPVAVPAELRRPAAGAGGARLRAEP